MLPLKDRVVISTPLKQIWTDEEILPVERGNYLNRNEISALLKLTKVFFVIANVGDKLEWVNLDNCYQRYKEKISKHLVGSTDNTIDLNQFEEGLAYFASMWGHKSGYPIVLLETVH